MAAAEEKQGGEFFIAGRLRGIPLVSHTSEPKRSEINASAIGDKLKSASETQIENRARDRLNPVGKRDAPGENVGGILFKQTGSTSSISNLIRSTTRKPTRQQPARPSATTQRPPVIRSTTSRRMPSTRPTTTTSRRPTTTTTTRRQVLAARGAAGAPAKVIRAEGGTETPSTSTSTSSPAVRMSLEPISSVKMSTLEAAASSQPMPDGATGSSLPFLVAATTASSAQQQQRQEQQQQQQQQLFERTTLTRSMQTLTTQPVNQRRNQQNLIVQSQRAGSSNRMGIQDGSRNGYAGPNWYLFNRPDGNFSMFEILVLVSNVLIVCTIVLVILFNWIKMFKKRRQASGELLAQINPKQQLQQTPVAVAAGASQRVAEQAGITERMSKASPVSSVATSMATSAIDGITMTTTTTGASQMPAGLRKLEQPPLDEAAGRVGLVGDAQRIASEFSQAGAKVANKAVAIVKSIENNLNSNGDSPDKLKLKAELVAENGVRPISRSMSDLTPASGTSPIRQAHEGPGQLRASANTTPDRVERLEKLTDNRETNKPSKMDNNKQALHSSRDSLESIELPSNLVESIKRTAAGPLRAGQLDETQVPSPNLLLGQVEGKVELATGSSEQKAADMTTVAANGNGGEKIETAVKSPDGEKPSSGRPGNPLMLDASESKNGTKANPQATTVQSEARGKPPPPPASKQASLDKEAGKRGEASQADQKAKRAAGKGEPQAKAQTATSEKGAEFRAKQVDNKQDGDKQQQQHQRQPPVRQTADVKNHQVVVNRLDKRKTNLEIVDLRDASVTGKMPSGEDDAKGQEESGSAWISMDGVAVVKPRSMAPSSSPNFAGEFPGGSQQAALDQQQQQLMAAAMSPSEIIESRFHVDYKSKRRQEKSAATAATSEGTETRQAMKNSESMDSKQEEYVFNNIENELELDNKMRNRKYFVYIVHDGHFTARKECIARIELPPKRRITLAELRQLIASSQDVSLSSLRRNRFKFVTETYRLLNENEDAAVLHQVYPTQGVFLKLNVSEQENQVYPFKGGRSARLSSGGGGGGSSGAPGASSLSNTTIASRRRANARTGAIRAGARDGALPAIEVNNYGTRDRTRASSVVRTRQAAAGGGAYRRSKSSVQVGRNNGGQAGEGGGGMKRGQSGMSLSDHTLPPIGTSKNVAAGGGGGGGRTGGLAPGSKAPRRSDSTSRQTISGAASDLGANVISGARKLLNTTFGL